MQNNDFIFESALNKKLKSPEFTYGGAQDYSIMNTPVSSSLPASEASATGILIGTPEMMGVSAGLQILGQYLDAPYKEMAAKQSMEEQRKDRQSAALFFS